MNKKILIVDDDPVSIKLIRSKIEQEGYTVLYAENGKIGLEIANTEDPDVIITDIVMPVMDGVDLFRELKKSIRTANIPIIVITESRVIEESFRRLGINDFFAKPLDGFKVIEKVRQVVALKKQRFGQRKILVSGNYRAITSEMEDLLSEENYVTLSTEEGAEVVSKALLMVPDFILLDVLQKDISAKEIIKALRCFVKIKGSNIVVYNSFNSDDVGNPAMLTLLSGEKEACFESGSNYYLGRYSRSNFIENFNALISLASSPKDNLKS
ncbi:MAG: response regulator [Candidatus Omnitrophica bacterium]|nr:response regulator [Candidatus Omnitrophota bacterium]